MNFLPKSWVKETLCGSLAPSTLREGKGQWQGVGIRKWTGSSALCSRTLPGSTSPCNHEMINKIIKGLEGGNGFSRKLVHRPNSGSSYEKKTGSECTAPEPAGTVRELGWPWYPTPGSYYPHEVYLSLGLEQQKQADVMERTARVLKPCTGQLCAFTRPRLQACG